MKGRFSISQVFFKAISIRFPMTIKWCHRILDHLYLSNNTIELYDGYRMEQDMHAYSHFLTLRILGDVSLVVFFWFFSLSCLWLLTLIIQVLIASFRFASFGTPHDRSFLLFFFNVHWWIDQWHAVFSSLHNWSHSDMWTWLMNESKKLLVYPANSISNRYVPGLYLDKWFVFFFIKYSNKYNDDIYTTCTIYKNIHIYFNIFSRSFDCMKILEKSMQYRNFHKTAFSFSACDLVSETAKQFFKLCDLLFYLMESLFLNQCTSACISSEISVIEVCTAFDVFLNVFVFVFYILSSPVGCLLLHSNCLQFIIDVPKHTVTLSVHILVLYSLLDSCLVHMHSFNTSAPCFNVM